MNTAKSLAQKLDVLDVCERVFIANGVPTFKLAGIEIQKIRGRTRRFGSFHRPHFSWPVIKLSPALFAKPEFHCELVDTFLHEVAHAIVFFAGKRDLERHGPLWRAIARDLGCADRAKATGVVAKEVAKLSTIPVLRCPACGYVWFGAKRRARHRVYRHTRCPNETNPALEHL